MCRVPEQEVIESTAPMTLPARHPPVQLTVRQDRRLLAAPDFLVAQGQMLRRRAPCRKRVDHKV